MRWIDCDGWLWEHMDGKPVILSKQGDAYLTAYEKGHAKGMEDAGGVDLIVHMDAAEATGYAKGLEDAARLADRMDAVGHIAAAIRALAGKETT